MPTTVGQHAVSAFTSPSNGDALDATVVKGNDNTMRSAYVDHDADPGIHLQSSTLTLRPAAGVEGRKWLTAEGGAYRLWYDDGTAWQELNSVGTLASLAVTGSATISGALTVDTDTFVLDATNNRVGIGAAPVSPYRLQVTGGSSRFIGTAGVSAIVVSTPATELPQIAFRNASSALMEIGAAGTGFDYGFIRLGASQPLQIQDSSSNVLLTVKTTGQVRFEPRASAPSGAQAGDVYYNSFFNRLQYYNGTAWVSL